MCILLFNIWPFTSIKFCSMAYNILQVGLKFCQIQNIPCKIGQTLVYILPKVAKCCQIWSHCLRRNHFSHALTKSKFSTDDSSWMNQLSSRLRLGLALKRPRSNGHGRRLIFEGRGFQSQHPIQHGYYFTMIWWKNEMLDLKEANKW